MKIIQSGFSAVLLIVSILTISAAVCAGYFYIKTTKNFDNNTTSTKDTSSTDESRKENTEELTQSEERKSTNTLRIQDLEIEFTNQLGEDASFIKKDAMYFGFGSKYYTSKLKTIDGVSKDGDGGDFCSSLVTVRKFAQKSDADLTGDGAGVAQIQLDNGFYVIYHPQTTCVPFAAAEQDNYDELEEERANLMQKLISDLKTMQAIKE